MRAAVLLAAFTLSAPWNLTAQWTLQQSNTTADLRGIDNVGYGVAWASGTNGTVLHTTDKGATWLRCKTPPDAEHLDFRGIQAFDANTAIVMSSGKGDLSRLYKTTDECQTWKLVFANPDKDGFWDTVRFSKASPAHGSVIGDPVDGAFVIYSTGDQGGTWMRWLSDSFSPSVSARKNESLFAASNSAAGGKEVGGIFSFVTGGGSGSRFVRVTLGESAKKRLNHIGLVALDLPFAMGEADGAFSMSEAPDGSVMIVGGDYTRPVEGAPSIYLYPTTGLQNRTTETLSGKTNGYRSAVAYDRTTNTWITIGPNGTDISTDDGRNWRALKPSATDTPDADQHWNALSLPFVVGPHGRIGLLNSTALQPAKH